MIDQLAHAQGRRDETPNIELAQHIAHTQNQHAVVELLNLVATGSRAAQNDSIKVLYEIGALRADLLQPHVDTFVTWAASSNNRLSWGAFTALDAIAASYPSEIAAHLREIVKHGQNVSVIGRDKIVALLCKLAQAGFQKKAVPHLLTAIKNSPDNQLPMYAEQAQHVFSAKNRDAFRSILARRLKKIASATKRKRLEKVLRALDKKSSI